jgi:hypothetical protein
MDGRFLVKAGEDPIPPSLLTAILGGGSPAQKVEGSWVIEEGDELILSELTADGRPARGTARLHVWNAGVIRISLPSDANAQYVFSR